MSRKEEIPFALQKACTDWTGALEAMESRDRRMDFIQRALPELMKDRNLFFEILDRIASGASYPDTRRATLFSTEIVLFLHERRAFSLRMLLARPGQATPIHDHNAWGVISPLVGLLGVIRYERLDDGSRETVANIRESSHRVLRPFETETVLPLNEGIHRTGNEGDGVLVMISVYGRPGRRNHVLEFDPTRGRVTYTPRALRNDCWPGRP